MPHRQSLPDRSGVVRVTLYRCKATNVETGLAAADGRCKHWTFGPDWICPFHMDAGVEAFVMVPEADPAFDDNLERNTNG